MGCECKMGLDWPLLGGSSYYETCCPEVCGHNSVSKVAFQFCEVAFWVSEVVDCVVMSVHLFQLLVLA